MADQKIQEFPVDPSTLFGAAMPFRFEVVWPSLTATFGVPIVPELPGGGSDREFETVLHRLMPLRAAPVPAPTPPEPEANIAFPQFRGPSESRRVMSVVGAVLCLALGASVTLWIREASSPKPDAAAATEMGGGGWIAEWASDASGSSRGRQLSLYRPSTAMSDYRLEFRGTIERRSLGCVFRAVDSNNYYAVKLVAGRLGTPLFISRFAVIHGVEGRHVERTLALTTGVDTRLKVRLDVNGPRFTVWVQNQVVEDWEDDQLKSGGVGFLNEREESGDVQSVQISFPTGGTRR